MSIRVNQKDRWLLLGAGFVFVLLVVAALVFSSSEKGQAEYPTSYSSASGGAKAAYLLLSETGYHVQRWERPLSDLPEAKSRTLILAEPDEAPTRQERERLKAFVSEGGHIIATGMFAGTFLPTDESVPDIFSGITWKTASSLSPSKITRAAPQIVLAPRAHWQPISAAYPLYGDGNHTLVVKYPFGRGEVLWWASATPLTNAGLKEQGNLEFFLASLGDQKNEILWDEYIHGYRETLAASVFHFGAAVAQTVDVLFLARLFGVMLTVPQLATVIFAVVLVSFAVPGIPGGSIIAMVPVLAAANLPIDGISILLAVDTIPDMFRTTANTTGAMTLAAILPANGKTRKA